MTTTKKMAVNGFSLKYRTDFLIIPDALVIHARGTIFSTWQVLELQLSQVDPVKDPEIYQALVDMANTLFNSWLQFRRA